MSLKPTHIPEQPTLARGHRSRRNFIRDAAMLGLASGAYLHPIWSASAMVTGDSRPHVFKDSFGLRIKVPVEWGALRQIVPSMLRLRGSVRRKYDLKARKWGTPKWVRKSGENYITLHTVALERVEPTPAQYTETWAWIPIHLDLGGGGVWGANWIPIAWASERAPGHEAAENGRSRLVSIPKVRRDGADVFVSLHNLQGDQILSASAKLDSTEVQDYRTYTMSNLTSGQLPSEAPLGSTLYLQETQFSFSEKRVAVPGMAKLQISDADPFLSALGLSKARSSDVLQWQAGRFDLTIGAVKPINSANLVDPLTYGA